MDFDDAPGPKDILIKARQPLAIEVDVKRRQQDWAFSKSRNLVLDLDDKRVQHIQIASPHPVQSAFLTVAKKPACFLPSLASKPPLPTAKVRLALSTYVCWVWQQDKLDKLVGEHSWWPTECA